MRTDAKATLGFVALSLFIGLCTPACLRSKKAAQSPLAESAPVQTTPPPPWLPPYDADITALLAAGVEAPVQVPAQATYPDLSRFTFTGEAVLNVPDDLINYANLVYRTIEQSPRLYVFRSAPQPPQNTVALYGPAQPDEPDLWTRSVVQPPSDSRLLVPAAPPDDVRSLLTNISSPPPAEALDTLKRAASLSPQSPGVHTLLAESALAAGQLDVSEDACKAALQIDPYFPPAHRVLAEIALARKDNAKAKDELSEALALYPTSSRAWKVTSALIGVGAERYIGVQPPFIEVNSSGAITIVSCDSPFCERYAACKAAFRYEPDLRTAILNQGLSIPYHLSATEELVCVEAGLGAYASARQQPGAKTAMPSDPTAESLIRLARERGLTSFVLFDIIGTYRPDVLRTAPLPVHEAIVRYVKSKVFGLADPNRRASATAPAITTAPATGIRPAPVPTSSAKPAGALPSPIPTQAPLPAKPGSKPLPGSAQPLPQQVPQQIPNPTPFEGDI